MNIIEPFHSQKAKLLQLAFERTYRKSTNEWRDAIFTRLNWDGVRLQLFQGWVKLIFTRWHSCASVLLRLNLYMSHIHGACPLSCLVRAVTVRGAKHARSEYFCFCAVPVPNFLVYSWLTVRSESPWMLGSTVTSLVFVCTLSYHCSDFDWYKCAFTALYMQCRQWLAYVKPGTADSVDP